MGITLKNLRPGVLILADAKLRLGPGETAETTTITPQIQKAIGSGLLARLDVNGAAITQPAAQPPETSEPAAEGNDADTASRRGGQGGKRPPLDALRRKAEEAPGGTG